MKTEIREFHEEGPDIINKDPKTSDVEVLEDQYGWSIPIKQKCDPCTEK